MSTAAQDALRSYSAAAGETKNAYNTELAAGGSSGGPAVSVSLNFAAASLGTDTNSSLRIPAALAGCVSLRPTFGLLSNNGIKRLNRTRDIAGAITRTVYDQAIMLDALTYGQYNYTENLDGKALQGLRIGVLEELTYQSGGYRRTGKIDTEVAYVFERALQIMRDCGAEVVTVSIPNVLSLAEQTMYTNKDSLKQKLYNAFTKALEENKLKVVEMKTAVGQLNEKSKYQFFTAALVQSDSASIPQATADTLAKLFTEAGLVVQTGSKVESPYLVYKEIEFKHTDFSAGNYFVIYAYHEDLAANLPNINADATSST